MRRPVTQDELDQMVLGGSRQEYQETAQHLAELAADPHPDDEVGVADLLLQAGDYASLGGDEAWALALYRQAVDAGGEAVVDPRCFLLGALLKLEREAEADDVAAAIRRSKVAEPLAFEVVGEAYEMHGALDKALRWFTRGVLVAERGTDDEHRSTLALLQGARYRVRKEMGFPEDADDLAAVRRLAGRGALGADYDEDEDYDGGEDFDEDDDGSLGDAAVTELPPRNAPCPCGSTKKYKHCHGRGTRYQSIGTLADQP